MTQGTRREKVNYFVPGLPRQRYNLYDINRLSPGLRSWINDPL